MKEMEKLLMELDEKVPNWKQKLFDEDIYDNELFEKLFAKLLKEIKKEYKENREAAQEFLKANLEEAYDSISGYIIKLLKGYDATKRLRELQLQSTEQVKIIVRYLFDNCIIYLEKNFEKCYKSYLFETQQEFIQLARILDQLVTYYVEKHFSFKSISDDFMEETGLNREISDFFASTIVQNYSVLMINTISDKIKSLDERISTIEDWIEDFEE